MGQTVYADLLFLINFSMDFLCFYITSAILHRKLSAVRALLASVGGGVYSVAVLFAYLAPPFGLVCDAAACILMCAAVFTGRRVTFGRFLLSTATYVGVSAALGGMMTALFNLLNTLELPLDTLKSDAEGIPVWFFALLAAVSGVATLMGGRFFRAKQSERSARVEIGYGGRRVELFAVCDTGNLVRDPVSGRSVVVADLSSLRPLLPEALIRAVRENNASHLSELPDEIARDLHIIPARSVGGTSLLFALRPDSMTVTGADGKPHEIDALFAPAPIGSSARGYQALLPPELLV